MIEERETVMGYQIVRVFTPVEKQQIHDQYRALPGGEKRLKTMRTCWHIKWPVLYQIVHEMRPQPTYHAPNPSGKR